MYWASVGQEKVFTKWLILLNGGIANQNFTVLKFLYSVFHQVLSLFSRRTIPWSDVVFIFLVLDSGWNFDCFPHSISANIGAV
jgi:hypothetical protein